MVILHLILIVGIGLLCACSAKASPGPVTRKFNETDSGRSIELHIGDRLEILLPGNPTTGYQWNIETQETIILQPTGGPEYKPSDNLVGGGGLFIFRFEAIKTGGVNLKLGYSQPFERSQKPSQTFELTIIIK